MEKASIKQRELREAEARASQQHLLTESELGITVQSNQGKADYQRSVQQASQIKALAQAEADKLKAMAEAEAARVRMLGEAEADRAARVGVAQAVAVEEQVRAYGGPRYQLTQQVMARFSEAIGTSGVDVVPKIVISSASTTPGSGGGASGGSGVLESMLTLLLSGRLEDVMPPPSKNGESGGDPAVQAYRDDVRRQVQETLSRK